MAESQEIDSVLTEVRRLFNSIEAANAQGDINTMIAVWEQIDSFRPRLLALAETDNAVAHDLSAQFRAVSAQIEAHKQKVDHNAELLKEFRHFADRYIALMRSHQDALSTPEMFQSEDFSAKHLGENHQN